jgi:exodeoxyribonuclease VII small subunit
MKRKEVSTDAGGERGQPKSFEDALARLEQIVERLESGEESLEDSLRLYEEATALGRYCQQRLQAAEERIAKLANERDDEPQRHEDTKGK